MMKSNVGPSGMFCFERSTPVLGVL